MPVIGPGSYRPLSDRDVERIHQTALDVLESIGMASPIPILREHALAKGCRIDERGRLCFPRALVEDVLAGAAREYVAHGRDPKNDVEISGSRVHFDAGGESVLTLDFESGRYRSSTLIDLYDFARLVDQLDHVQLLSRVVAATEIPDRFANDINTASGLNACVQLGATGEDPACVETGWSPISRCNSKESL